MPNGDPDWHLTELPKLESFFAPLAEEIETFVAAHNMHIERYYHQAPDWRLRFAPPQGGNAMIDIRRLDDQTFTLFKIWYRDDYDTATRFARVSRAPAHQVSRDSLRGALSEALAEIPSWRDGEWSHVTRGYERIWHKRSREEFEAASPKWPRVCP